MASTPSRTQIGLYVLLVGTLSAVTIVLLYGVFASGLTAGIESFLEDPSGTIQENPLGLLGVTGIFASLFVLVAVVVLGGARFADLETNGSRPK